MIKVGDTLVSNSFAGKLVKGESYVVTEVHEGNEHTPEVMVSVRMPSNNEAIYYLWRFNQQ